MLQRTRTLLAISKTSQEFVEIINMLASPAPGITWTAIPPECSPADIKVHSWGPCLATVFYTMTWAWIAAGPQSYYGCYGAVLLFVEGQGPVFWELCPSELLRICFCQCPLTTCSGASTRSHAPWLPPDAWARKQQKNETLKLKALNK